MKKLPIIIAVILISALALSGCGGGNNGPAASPLSIAESLVPATGTTSFPTGTDDLGGNCTTVNYPYYIAKTEVTYQLWSTVYSWATDHKYIFANPGKRGGYHNKTTRVSGQYSTGHETDPVSTVSWRDAIVWCNALTEYYNARNGTSLACVYKDGGTIIRDSTNGTLCDSVVPDSTAKGFRLPTSMEWELAARYKDGSTWTPGDYASGATANFNNATATGTVAWHNGNSDVPVTDTTSSQPVGQKASNSLGLYDMSGNMMEWCFDKKVNDDSRVMRGGSWFALASWLQVGLVSYSSPFDSLWFIGFRVARTQ